MIRSVLSELTRDRVAKCVKGSTTFVTALNAPALGRAKSDVPAVRPQRARFAIVIVAAGYEAPVNLPDELIVDGAISRLRTQPAIGGLRSPELPLRVGQVRARY